MKLLTNNPKRKPQITLTSLIDVILLLLIFFMLTSHFVQQQGMDLSLPKSNSKASSMENKLEIIISKKADIFVNDQKVKIEELKDVIANHSQDKSVILKADKSISHGIVVEIMDKIRSNGNKKIIIATQKREKK